MRRIQQSKNNFQHPEQEIQFDVHILDAAKSIAGAVSTLVRAASVAERELVAQNRVELEIRSDVIIKVFRTFSLEISINGAKAWSLQQEP